MPFQYDAPASTPELRQGEILEGIWEHRALQTNPAADDSPVQVLSVHHPTVVVMTADCDLLQDFNARPPADPNSPRLVSHVLLCDAYDGEPLKLRFQERGLWRRVEQNQDERYHHLDAAEVRAADSSVIDKLADLYLDFKKAFGLPPESLYQGIRVAQVRRRATIPPVYLHDLMHRFYGFLSRVALPD